jgi:hypothetical protein
MRQYTWNLEKERQKSNNEEKKMPPHKQAAFNNPYNHG